MERWFLATLQLTRCKHQKKVCTVHETRDSVLTNNPVFQSFQTEGYRLKYFRIPISPEQAPEDNYFDEYINVIRNLEPTDPLIFNCGMGAVRSKFFLVYGSVYSYSLWI